MKINQLFDLEKKRLMKVALLLVSSIIISVVIRSRKLIVRNGELATLYLKGKVVLLEAGEYSRRPFGLDPAIIVRKKFGYVFKNIFFTRLKNNKKIIHDVHLYLNFLVKDPVAYKGNEVAVFKVVYKNVPKIMSDYFKKNKIIIDKPLQEIEIDGDIVERVEILINKYGVIIDVSEPIRAKVDSTFDLLKELSQRYVESLFIEKQNCLSENSCKKTLPLRDFLKTF